VRLSHEYDAGARRQLLWAGPRHVRAGNLVPAGRARRVLLQLLFLSLRSVERARSGDGAGRCLGPKMGCSQSIIEKAQSYVSLPLAHALSASPPSHRSGLQAH
jgi:hypothetical protein